MGINKQFTYLLNEIFIHVTMHSDTAIALRLRMTDTIDLQLQVPKFRQFFTQKACCWQVNVAFRLALRKRRRHEKRATFYLIESQPHVVSRQ